MVPAGVLALARVARWAPIVMTGALAMLVITFMKHSDDGYDMLTATRLTIVFIAAGAAMLLDDPAANVTAHSPSPLSYRRGLRLALGAVVVGIVWLACVWYVAGTPRALLGGTIAGGLAFPMLRFSIELAALVIATLVIAMVAARTIGDDRGGIAGAPGLLAVLLLLSHLPQRWSMFTAPGSERWSDSGRDWTVAACALLATLAVLSVDPARRTLRARISRSTA